MHDLEMRGIAKNIFDPRERGQDFGHRLSNWASESVLLRNSLLRQACLHRRGREEWESGVHRVLMQRVSEGASR